MTISRMLYEGGAITVSVITAVNLICGEPISCRDAEILSAALCFGFLSLLLLAPAAFLAK